MGEDLSDRHALNFHDQPALGPKVGLPEGSHEKLFLLRRPNEAALELNRSGDLPEISKVFTTTRSIKKGRIVGKLDSADLALAMDHPRYKEWESSSSRRTAIKLQQTTQNDLEIRMGMRLQSGGSSKSVEHVLANHVDSETLLEEYKAYAKNKDKLQREKRNEIRAILAVIQQSNASESTPPPAHYSSSSSDIIRAQDIRVDTSSSSPDIARAPDIRVNTPDPVEPRPQTTDERRKKQQLMREPSHLLDTALTCTSRF
jgi:hypothetical protein